MTRTAENYDDYFAATIRGYVVVGFPGDGCNDQCRIVGCLGSDPRDLVWENAEDSAFFLTISHHPLDLAVDEDEATRSHQVASERPSELLDLFVDDDNNNTLEHLCNNPNLSWWAAQRLITRNDVPVRIKLLLLENPAVERWPESVWFAILDSGHEQLRVKAVEHPQCPLRMRTLLSVIH